MISWVLQQALAGAGVVIRSAWGVFWSLGMIGQFFALIVAVAIVNAVLPWIAPHLTALALFGLVLVLFAGMLRGRP